ncbi:hypothetical protein [Cecembia sp.]|uniref:hypothetical protein n=1 Tax=Cecembia sp. TaxID=1898110 RepID=UPI0025C2B3D6|nr:hypothetical protein [Cecembia sp.]
MKERLEVLLDRYWEGETSLEEEKELRDLLSIMDGYETEKAFFLGISDFSELQEANLANPAKGYKRFIPFWSGIAAGLLVFLVSGVSIYLHQKKSAEKEAFEQVIQAFSLIQENMQRGTENLQLLQEFQYLNTPNEIFDIENE